MTEQRLITPPPELVQQWYNECLEANEALLPFVATQAARWGADRELEACCEWLKGTAHIGIELELINARRPKPPSLAEEALKALKRQAARSVPSLFATEDCDTIRAALERLQELEGNG